MPKKKKKKQDVMMPDLSGIKFEDAVKALLQTPVGKEQINKARKHGNESLDKAVAEAKTRFQKP
jgi:hypothetical protein